MNLNSNLNTAACQGAFNATYQQSGGKNMYNLAEKYYEKQLYLNIDKNIIYSVAGLGAGVDAYNKKEIRIQAPLKPIFDNISMDLSLENQSYSIQKIWNF